MKIDGYAVIEINLEGKGRIKEVSYFDIRLENCEIEDNMVEDILAQLPEGINDVLVMALFTVHWEMSYSHEGGHECDGVTIQLHTHHIVIPKYKEFYREQVTEYTRFIHSPGVEHFFSAIEIDDMQREIWGWEEFYNEEFSPFVPPPSDLIRLRNSFKLEGKINE